MEKILFTLGFWFFCCFFFTFFDFCKCIFSTAVKLLVYAVLNKTELKSGLKVSVLFNIGDLWSFFFFVVVFLSDQTTSDGSQQYLWLRSRPDSFSMSESLMEKSKIKAFPLILSGFDDLGSTGTPCCTAQRSRT